ncbi:MAG: DUF2271 domain-containing protein [Firmicutes bacterium]|nr:DUF2271 domain-containing protein [Bacillota bacterium]
MKMHFFLWFIVILLLSFLICSCVGGNTEIAPSPLLTEPSTSVTQIPENIAKPDSFPETSQPVPPPDEIPDDLNEETANTSVEIDSQPLDITVPAISSDNPEGKVIISFTYEKQSGSASNQFAVWIENLDGQLIKTLYATDFTAKGGYKNRPDSLALWVQKSDLSSLTKKDIDAVSGATPKTGALTFTWDLTDMNGDTVAHDEYLFCVEGTLRWQNRILYSGFIKVGDRPTTAEANAEYFYAVSGTNPALTEASPENNMIGLVTAEYIPGWAILY